MQGARKELVKFDLWMLCYFELYIVLFNETADVSSRVVKLTHKTVWKNIQLLLQRMLSVKKNILSFLADSHLLSLLAEHWDQLAPGQYLSSVFCLNLRRFHLSLSISDKLLSFCSLPSIVKYLSFSCIDFSRPKFNCLWRNWVVFFFHELRG